MSTANFTTMDNFDLWVYEPDFCGDLPENPDEWDYATAYKAFDSNFETLPKPKTDFFDISLKSGHYSGVQIYVDYKPDLCDPKYLTNDDTRYFLDLPLSVAKRKHEAEIRRIQKWLARLGRIGAVKLMAVARFQTGRCGMNEPKQTKRTYLTAHKANGRFYFKEHKTKKPDLWTQIQQFKKGTENGNTKKTETNR